MSVYKYCQERVCVYIVVALDYKSLLNYRGSWDAS